MRRVSIMSDTKVLPLRNVISCDVRVIRCIGGVTCEISNNAHCTDADDAFEREISLVTTSRVSAYVIGNKEGELTREPQQSRLMRSDSRA